MKGYQKLIHQPLGELKVSFEIYKIVEIVL